jgi:hypothetical protein
MRERWLIEFERDAGGRWETGMIQPPEARKLAAALLHRAAQDEAPSGLTVCPDCVDLMCGVPEARPCR